MTTTIKRSAGKRVSGAIVLSLGLILAGCAGMSANRSLYSVHEPVIERTNYTLDLTTGPGGMPLSEQRRLAGWFDAMKLRYGDRIAIDDPVKSGVTRAAIEDLVGKSGLLLSDEAPVTPGYVNAGTVRVVLTRSTATVPGCPDWSTKSAANPMNATSHGYGCAVNSNMAAMIANPEHLIRGEDSPGETVIMSSTKAIDQYREATPTGSAGLSKQAAGGS